MFNIAKFKKRDVALVSPPTIILYRALTFQFTFLNLLILCNTLYICCFSCSSVDKESVCSAGDSGSIPGLGRSPGEGNGSPLQYPCLENLMDKGAWCATVQKYYST